MLTATRNHNKKIRIRQEKVNREKNRQALLNLIQGAALYGICVSIPTIFGVIVRVYEDGRLSSYRSNGSNNHYENYTISSLHDNGSMMNSEYPILKKMGSTVSYFLSQFYTFTANYHDDYNNNSNSNNNSNNNNNSNIHNSSNHYHASGHVGQHQLNYFNLICTLSVILATLRLIIVYVIVPTPNTISKVGHNDENEDRNNRNGGQNSNATIIRCRSTHMLRSFDAVDDNHTTSISSLKHPQQTQFAASKQTKGRDKARDRDRDRDNIDLSAPMRYATALFRLLYTFIASISAFYLFRNADFWPLYLGGKFTSSTANCWDLSGGIAFADGFDQDFDHFNAALRYYFVVQASYQIQSLFFHCFLFLFGSKTTTWKIQKSWNDFLRTFAEHIVALAFLSSAFLFSSARRLSTVAMFALDASGFFLHFLQICCLNALDNNTTTINPNQNQDFHYFHPPSNIHFKKGAVLIGNTDTLQIKNKQTNTIQRRKNIVWFVHRCLVLPSFMYSRFFILPFIAWHSVAFESHEWLKQMEHAFFPGWGNVVYYFFNGLLMIIITLNLVLFRRLLFHPHVSQVLRCDMPE